MRPRQLHALGNPCDKGDAAAGVAFTFYRVNAPFQSILTFDLFLEEDVPEDVKNVHFKEGRCGIWHARVTTFPEAKLDAWDEGKIEKAKIILRGLVRGVGMGDSIESPSGDGLAIHSWKWGNISEVAQALRAREGINARRRSGESKENPTEQTLSDASQKGG